MNMYDLKDMQREVNIIPVLQGEGLPKVKDSELPDVLPILALRNAVILPGTVYPVTIGRDKSMRLVREAEEKNLFIGALPQKDVSVEEPGKADLYGYGVVARVVKMLEMPDGSVTAILQSFKRFELEDIIQSDPYLVARVHYLDDFVPQIEPSTQKMLSESLREKAGNNGSDNFAVVYDAGAWGANPAALTFSDQEPRVIESLYVVNTLYTHYVLFYGNDYCTPLADNGFFKVTATGYFGENQTGTSEFYLANKNRQFVTKWTKWDLSELGFVDKVVFSVSGSEELYGDWGINAPTYFAIDDIAVRVYPD